MRKAVALNLFKGFSIGMNSVVISHHQYADDTLCIGEVLVKNLWALKAILRGFELSSGLKINFWKSGLMGANVSPTFLTMASTFLNCRLGTIPFTYVGPPIGANPKSGSTWKPGTSFGPSPEEVVLLAGGNKIKWVKWSVVCKTKRMGGLGVRDVRLVNLSLLAKWRWRLLLPGSSLWKEVLVAKYGGIEQKLASGVGGWKGGKWKIYSLLDVKLDWDLFQWEEDLVTWLREILEPVALSLVEDSWSWRPDPEGKFSVNSAYLLLVEELWLGEELEEEVALVFDQIWDSPAPSKVIAFSWQLLYDRISTRRNLEARGLLGLDMPWKCVGCVGRVETSTHLFLHCPSAMMVWYDVFRWLGVVLVIPPSMLLLFEARNNALFANGIFNPKVIVEEIKVLSWKWCLARTKLSPCIFMNGLVTQESVFFGDLAGGCAIGV
ncbi:hypothetical protein TSUD_361750 [Trifolium subterraneum]|uniref:Reverse transcriptase zinc-binding domain-containing protein n=1 Tax=Trifolium subterraneum TaxID=3900 RepID=A0A2Z6M358_TRISU|nr:hypothetical protein TSUD_361750 [Trifolium subterraneum]